MFWLETAFFCCVPEQVFRKNLADISLTLRFTRRHFSYLSIITSAHVHAILKKLADILGHFPTFPNVGKCRRMSAGVSGFKIYHGGLNINKSRAKCRRKRGMSAKCRRGILEKFSENSFGVGYVECFTGSKSKL